MRHAWKVNTRQPEPDVVEISDAETGIVLIAQAFGSNGRCFERAKLIAAAPEMADMLLSAFVHVSHGGTPPPSWSSGMTMTANKTVIENDGVYWLAKVSGTAGTTQPTFPNQSANWSLTTYSGTTVTDGTSTWQYVGDACPSETVDLARQLEALLRKAGILSNPLPSDGGVA